jgi:hypothetical protein
LRECVLDNCSLRPAGCSTEAVLEVHGCGSAGIAAVGGTTSDGLNTAMAIAEIAVARLGEDDDDFFLARGGREQTLVDECDEGSVLAVVARSYLCGELLRSIPEEGRVSAVPLVNCRLIVDAVVRSFLASCQKEQSNGASGGNVKRPHKKSSMGLDAAGDLRVYTVASIRASACVRQHARVTSGN